MAVGDIERAVEGLVNRGIGNSGLTQRLVGQMNIEELRDLNSAIAESKATVFNQEESRRAVIAGEEAKISSSLMSQRIAQFLKERQQLALGGGSGARQTQVTNGPTALLQTIPVDPLGGRNRFKLTFAGASEGHPQQELAFETIEALREAIRSPRFQDTRIVLEGTPSSDALAQQVRSLGIQQVSGEEAKQLVKSIIPRGGGTPLFVNRRSSTPPASRTQDILTNIESGKGADLLELDTNTRAHIFEASAKELTTLANSTIQEQSQIGKAFLQAQREGRAGDFVNQLVKAGVLMPNTTTAKRRLGL